jgi:hypothetical protein
VSGRPAQKINEAPTVKVDGVYELRPSFKNGNKHVLCDGAFENAELAEEAQYTLVTFVCPFGDQSRSSPSHARLSVAESPTNDSVALFWGQDTETGKFSQRRMEYEPAVDGIDIARAPKDGGERDRIVIELEECCSTHLADGDCQSWPLM